VCRVPAPTQTGLTVILQHTAGRNILTFPGSITELTLADLDLESLSDSRLLHLSSYYLQKGLRPQVGKLFRKLKAAGLMISLDTNDDPDDRWEGDLRDVLGYVDIFLPNAREARKIVETEDLDLAVNKLSELVPLVVVKLGSEGAMAQRGRERVVSPAVRVTAVDPVGAGDSFDAGFLHQFLLGADLVTCLATGNLAGALSATAPGGTEAFRDAAHRQRFFREHSRTST